MTSSEQSPALQQFSLTGRVALVTGAAGHLGTAMVRGLAEAGAHVIINGRNEAPLRALASLLQESGGKVSLQPGDITDPHVVADIISHIERLHGRLDILVNNAYAGGPGSMDTARSEDFLSAYRVTVAAAFDLMEGCRPLLKKAAQKNRGGASIINIASMYASVSPDPGIYERLEDGNPPFYGSAKAGLLQLTRYAACQLAADGIRVNAISPGPFPAPAVAEQSPDFMARLARKNPMGRIGVPEELVGPLLFLASDAGSYVTGVDLPVDGGWTVW